MVQLTQFGSQLPRRFASKGAAALRNTGAHEPMVLSISDSPKW
jgi:hypothetical protein